MAMISFRGVSMTFRTRGLTRPIVRGLTLDLPRRNVAILGPNGAGKSTLLRLIAGSLLPTSGVIRRHCRVSWPLGFGGAFAGSLTGLENVRFVARIYGEDVRRLTAYVEEFSELGPSLRMPFSTYSSGMRARLAFGLSMAIRFDCYLVDEITAVGDASFRQKCRVVFKERLTESRMIMVSHSMATLRDYCDMALVMRDGLVHVFEGIDEAIQYHMHLMGETAEA